MPEEQRYTSTEQRKEDLLEQLFWEFDSESKRTGMVRDVFKGKMRYFHIIAKQMESESK